VCPVRRLLCAFRVSFYWAEADELGLPVHMTEQVSVQLSCMAGTNRRQPYCGALQGQVGTQVSCSVYAMRPSPCREVQPGDEKCATARARHGLAPLATS
jgi:Fe-S-cluster containining protein